VAEFEERADQLSLKDIDETLAEGQVFRTARNKLLGKGAKLLVGPRGTGKTHLMRHTYLVAMRQPKQPLALYANFNRYLTLEPLLRRAPDALQRFHAWVVAKLILSAFDFVHDCDGNGQVLSESNTLFDEERLRNLVSLLERGSGSVEYEDLGQHLTVSHALEASLTVARAYRRERVVFLLDDAALSLTDQYLVAFFEIYRLLKTELTAPKASVYPGSTQYGPTFHASHEAESVPLWLSVEDPDYLKVMGDIASRRFDQTTLSSVGTDVLELFKYVAFGSPRALLRLVRAYKALTDGTQQSRINRVIEEHTELVGAEYDSLGIKLRQFSSLVSTGRRFFDTAAQLLSQPTSESDKRSIVLGLAQSADRTPLADRMLRFLVEVGMLFPLTPVSHGTNRKYDRYIIHIAFLYRSAFFRSGRGSSPRDVIDYMQRPAAKHPLRRELTTILSETEMAGLRLDLPACQNCAAQRISESQKFCHICGTELVKSSMFEECMNLPLEKVPGISERMIARIKSDTNLRLVGDVYASQNASADLQQASYVGPVRAQAVVSKIAITVSEFLS
jgi:hypothetical protein